MDGQNLILERSSSINSPETDSGPNRFGKFYSLAFGQVLSILVAGTGACTTLFQKYSHMNAPSSQNAPNYVLLSLFLVSPFRKVCFVKNQTLKTEINSQNNDGGNDYWWRYIILSFIDVEANVTVVWAYQYTSITSAMLLDCFTIPSVMILSHIFLQAKYTWKHIFGAFLCLCGICCIILSDVIGGGDRSKYPHAWVGDILCIISAFLYSVSNVIQEKWVRTIGPPRFLGRLGICGAIISVSQSMIFERKALFNHTKWNAKGFGAWGGYTFTLTSAYILTSWFLVDADAAFFNLSLLTSDVYAVLFAYFVNGANIPFLYFVAFAFTISGLFIYHRTPPPTLSNFSSKYSPLQGLSPTSSISPLQQQQIDDSTLAEIDLEKDSIVSSDSKNSIIIRDDNVDNADGVEDNSECLEEKRQSPSEISSESR